MNFKIKEKGAALVIVLFIASILAIVAGLLITKTKQHIQRISIAKDYLEAERIVQTDLNHFIFNTQTSAYVVMGSSLISQEFKSGLPSNINLRGVSFKYRDSIFKVQDMGGLLPLIPFEKDIFSAYLRSKGWTSLDINRFIDVLADWQDHDSFQRINGAEKGQYRINEYPLNQIIQTVKELGVLANIAPDLLNELVEDKNIILYGAGSRTFDYVPDNLLSAFNTEFDAKLILKERELNKVEGKKDVITDYSTGNWIIEVSSSYNHAKSSKMIHLVRRLGEQRRPYVISRRQERN